MQRNDNEERTDADTEESVVETGSQSQTEQPTQRQEAGDSPAGDQTKYLVGVNYDDRAERRRAEYRLDKWDGSVEKLPGMARLVEGEGFYDLYEELQEAVDDVDNLYVYQLQDLAPSTTDAVARIDRAYDVDTDQVEWAIESLLNKREVTDRSDPPYQIYPSDADEPVTVDFHVTQAREGTRLEITIKGPSLAVNAMKDSMLRDIGYLLPEAEVVFDQ
jgi:hypothetical protein